MPRKLKVFRTAIGFHDAYVAAPSRKAALDAWGADADLFARGVAEEVTDARLKREPLERPGEVIRISRGGLTEHLKALPKRKQAKGPAGKAKPAPAKPRQTARPKPPPKRDKVDAAEEALATARDRHEAETASLERERDAIERKLDALRSKQAKERARLERRRDAARETYRKALDRWSDEA
jgi:hypothetical protein